MDERDAEEAYFDAALDAAEAEEGDRLANAHELGVCDEERCQWCTTAGLVDLTLIPEPHTSAPAVQLQFMVDDVVGLGAGDFGAVAEGAAVADRFVEGGSGGCRGGDRRNCSREQFG